MEVKVYDDENQLTDWTKYDSEGNEIFYASYWDGEESYRYEYTYENGKQVKQVRYYEGEKSSESTATYDNAGNLINVKAYTDGELNQEITIEYEAVKVTKEQAGKLEKVNSIVGT